MKKILTRCSFTPGAGFPSHFEMHPTWQGQLNSLQSFIFLFRGQISGCYLAFGAKNSMKTFLEVNIFKKLISQFFLFINKGL